MNGFSFKARDPNLDLKMGGLGACDVGDIWIGMSSSEASISIYIVATTLTLTRILIGGFYFPLWLAASHSLSEARHRGKLLSEAP